MDELIHGRQETDEIRLQYLARLVDDGKLEVLQREDERQGVPTRQTVPDARESSPNEICQTMNYR